MATDKELSDFLKSVEKRAFKRTAFAVRDDDSALDIVQDSMIRLAEKYIDRPAAELGPLREARLAPFGTVQVRVDEIDEDGDSGMPGTQTWSRSRWSPDGEELGVSLDEWPTEYDD